MTTAIWLWSIELFPVDAEGDSARLPDLKGYDVAATDDDTGFWIFGKKRMIPAGAVASIDSDKRRVELSLSKDEIKQAPDYDEKRRNDVDEQKHQEDYYGPLTSPRSGR
jgi:hypothetical protein